MHAVQWSRGPAAALLLLAVLGSASRPTKGQSTVVADPPQCSTCRITAKLVATLGRSSDPELLRDYPSVQVDAQGRFLVTGTIPRSHVMVYSPNGAFVRKYGREGSGPGEFRSLWRVQPLPGDSLLFIEQGNRRLTVLDSAGKYIRSFIVPFQPIDLDLFTSDTWVVSGMSFTEDRVGFPLHLITNTGLMRASFGGDMTVLAGRPSSTQRMLASDPKRKGVWSARPDRYELELWTPNDERMRVLDRSVKWFPDRDFEGSRNKWQDPIHPRLRDIYVDSAGFVWSIIALPKANWKPTPENFGPLSTHWQNLDTIVEVIDPETGKLLATQRFPWIASTFTNNGLVVSYREDADGIMVLDIWRPELQQIGGEKR